MPRVIEVTETNAFSCLNNYSNTPFVDANGVSFKSLINAYYYYMCEGNPSIQNAILHAKNVEYIVDIIGFEKYSGMSKPLSHNLKYNFAKTIALLRRLILLKLQQNPECVTMLLLTHGKGIRVINKHDLVLGCGQSRRGLNLTGNILMDLRDQFRVERQKANLDFMIKSMGSYKSPALSND
jgi:predicted NAD-dependent protein-ADP-ribosyltransferase YbiA (DUF1768 family)